MDTLQVIQLIQDKINKIDIDKVIMGEDSHIYLEEWQDFTLSVLKRIFGKNVDEYKEFERNIYAYQQPLFNNTWGSNDLEERSNIIKKWVEVNPTPTNYTI